MNRLALPRRLAWVLAVVFATAQLIAGVVAVASAGWPPLGLAALALAAAATATVVSPRLPEPVPRRALLPVLLALAAVPWLAGVAVPPTLEAPASTWWVASVGVALVVLTARGSRVGAWCGLATLALATVVLAGPIALATFGLLGVAVWIAAGQVISETLTIAARDADGVEAAERAANASTAAREAATLERRIRVAQTARLAQGMLDAIVAAEGDLDEEQRRECLHLEGALRDEIRGRRLLDDAVRAQVLLARRRGIAVTLLDEGGIDELPEDDLARVHAELARVLRASAAHRIIVRTVAPDSETAVTVVGLRHVPGAGSARDGDDDEVDLWLEIPRSSA